MKGFKYILAGCAMLAFGSCGDFLKEYSQDKEIKKSELNLIQQKSNMKFLIKTKLNKELFFIYCDINL